MDVGVLIRTFFYGVLIAVFFGVVSGAYPAWKNGASASRQGVDREGKMIAHLCRLAWNRRRTNLLLVGELFLSFLVLTPLIAGWVLFAAEELEPLGFEYEDVWSVRLSDRNYGERAQGDYRRNVELVWRELQVLDQVEAVALASEAPFRFPSSWYGITSVRISDVGLDVLGLQLLTGRWFQSGDEALDWTPAVIDRELSQALFGDEDPVGQGNRGLPRHGSARWELFPSPRPRSRGRRRGELFLLRKLRESRSAGFHIHADFPGVGRQSATELGQFSRKDSSGSGTGGWRDTQIPGPGGRSGRRVHRARGGVLGGTPGRMIVSASSKIWGLSPCSAA